MFTSTAEIEEEATAMASELSLRPDWFNRNAGAFVPPTGEPEGTVLLAREGIQVVVCPPEFLLAMKLRACRAGRDDEDIAVLTRLCGITTVAGCEALVRRVYLGEEEIPRRGYALLEQVLGEYELERTVPSIVLPPVDEPSGGATS